MNKFIVLTTINKLTKTIESLIEKKDWNLIIVGDLKTPHNYYRNIKNVIYLDPEYQEKTYKEYSDSLGWNTSCRRNIGFIEAYKRNCDILALIDDDNIPNDNWGEEIVVNKEIFRCRSFTSNNINVFDPLYVTKYSHLWHRGFPIDLIKRRNYTFSVKTIIPDVQVNLWNGDPDVDAIARMTQNHYTSFVQTDYFTTDLKFTPFNSQNTILSRKVIPYYMLLPGIGRVDDIWGAYLLQKQMKINIVYGPATVYQERNPHNLLDDFDKETYSYLNASKFLRDEIQLPTKTMFSYNLYRKIYSGME